MVEVHIMEHGLLMLEGRGTTVSASWYPVTAATSSGNGTYCTQWLAPSENAQPHISSTQIGTVTTGLKPRGENRKRTHATRRKVLNNQIQIRSDADDERTPNTLAPFTDANPSARHRRHPHRSSPRRSPRPAAWLKELAAAEGFEVRDDA